ncbi:hypothetical protein SESBI_42935 [Sesbania bispinosa]|nr:hypothetical protein SESBI_42935 [Sesbania bispinosa]
MEQTKQSKMEHNEDEESPLAVQIQGDDGSVSHKSSVGVTLITDYLDDVHCPFNFYDLIPNILYFSAHDLLTSCHFSNYWAIG